MEKVESKKVNRRKTAVVAVIVAVILILGVSSLVLLSKSTKIMLRSILKKMPLERCGGKKIESFGLNTPALLLLELTLLW